MSEPQWVESLPYLPSSTAAAHCELNEKGQVVGPKPHRARFHHTLITSAVDPIPPIPYGAKPKAVIILGAPGSGKSALLKELPPDQFVVVNPDAVKTCIHEYREATAQRARNADQMVHAESSFLCQQIQQYAIESRRNLVIESIGLNPDIQAQLIDHLQSRGYEVAIALTQLPAEQGAERATRHLSAQGRYLPDAAIRESYAQVPRSFLALKDKVPHFRVVDTRQPPPSLVWEKRQNAETIHSPHKLKEIFNVPTDPVRSTRRCQSVPGRARAAAGCERW